VGCDNGTKPVPVPKKALVLLKPAGGETYKVGDTMKIEWQINDSAAIENGSVIIFYSLDGGVTWPQTINNPEPPYGSFPMNILLRQWKIDSSCVSNTFMISVTDYVKGNRSKSGVITIKN
jgi:hypothetical protein